jgi:hypothetical protein
LPANGEKGFSLAGMGAPPPFLFENNLYNVFNNVLRATYLVRKNSNISRKTPIFWLKIAENGDHNIDPPAF